MRRLVLVLACGLAVSSPALCEDWRPVPGDSGSYFDNDFLKVDQASGLVVLRYASGSGKGPYKTWQGKKTPILVYALDCAGNQWVDLGMDYDGAGKLPKGWRNQEKIEDISAGVGPAGKAACSQRETLPKAVLP